MNNLVELDSSISEAQPKDPDSKEMQCVICQEKAEKKCSACKSVAYCCTDHQKLDWKDHKKVCQGFTIQKTADQGMVWIATRDLNAGDLLLDEGPIIQAPFWDFARIKGCKSKKCVTCGSRCFNKIKRTCSTCSWPVCSDQCEKDTLHMDNECKEFSSRKLKYPLPSRWPVGLLVFCIRVNSLKARDPKKFKQLMSLQDFYDLPGPNQELHKLDLPKGMYELLSRSSWLSREELRKLLRITKVNGFDSDARFGEGSEDLNVGIFLKNSRINHSCSPNCMSTFIPGILTKMQIRTSVPVVKGQELTLNYFEGFGFDSTNLRQQLVQSNNHGFVCKCKRCLDPTEFGTFLSGIKCFNCSSMLKADSDSDDVGFLLPVDPFNQIKEFQCHRCHVKVPAKTVSDTALPGIVRFAFSHIKEWGHPISFDRENLETLLFYYENIRDFKDTLHPNHWIIQRAMRLVIRIQEDDLKKMTKEELQKQVARLEHLFTVEDQLSPGWSKSKYNYSVLLTQAALVLLPKFNSVMSREEIIKLTRTYYKAEKTRLQLSGSNLSGGSEEKKLEMESQLNLLETLKKKFEERVSELSALCFTN